MTQPETGQPLTPGGRAGTGSPEAASPYAAINNGDLIGTFYETEGDPAIGRELSARLLAHAGVDGDPSTMPLVGRGGVQIRSPEGPLTLADYINFAAEHHFEALEGILEFLMVEAGTPEYESMRNAVLSRLQVGKG